MQTSFMNIHPYSFFMNTPSEQPSVPDFSKSLLTTDQLLRMPRQELLRGRRRPVWRHHYDPYAGPPIAQTVEEALANAAKAPPGFIPEVEMLTPEELDQRREEVLNGPPRPSSRSQARSLKAARKAARKR